MSGVLKLGSVSVILSDLIDVSGRPYLAGQISLQYVGEDMDLNAHLLVMNTERSLSVDHPFETAADISSTQFEGLFYLPNSSARAEMALSNPSDNPVLVRFAVDAEGSGRRNPPENNVLVKPHQTELIDVRLLLGASNDPLASRIEPRDHIAARVTLAHGGAPGDIRIQGMVMDLNGFSANMRFIETAMLKASKLMSAIPPMPGRVSSIILLSNSEEKETEVELEAHYTVNGDVRETQLRTVTVSGKSAEHFDLTSDFSNLPMGASNIALVINAEEDGVLADMLQVDDSASGVYQLPPKGYYSHEHGTHSFPVRIDGDFNTIITVANPSDSDALTYSMHFFYDGGIYTYNGRSLRPGEVLHIDIRLLRDQHSAGRNKEFIPSSVKGGQVKVSLFNASQSTVGQGHDGHQGHKSATGYASALLLDMVGKVSFTTCVPACPSPVLDAAFDIADDTLIVELSDGNADAPNVHYWFEDETDDIFGAPTQWQSSGSNIYGWGSSIWFNTTGENTLTAYISNPPCDPWPYNQEHCLSCNVANPTIDLYVLVRSIAFTTLDPDNDEIEVELDPSGLSGTLTLQLQDMTNLDITTIYSGTLLSKINLGNFGI